MDPKSIANLDPKLRETYERVMGTAAPSPSSNASVPPASPSTPVDNFATFSSPATPQGQDTSTPATSAPLTVDDLTAGIKTNSTTPQPGELPPSQNPASPDTSLVTPYTPQGSVDQNQVASASESFSAPASVNHAVQTDGPSVLIRVLYLIGAIIFFAVYTVFWIKVFGLKFLF